MGYWARELKAKVVTIRQILTRRLRPNSSGKAIPNSDCSYASRISRQAYFATDSCAEVISQKGTH